MKRELIPTPLVGPGEAPPITIVEQATPLGSFALARRILAFAGRFWWDTKVRKLGGLERAVKLRTFVESLGGMWVKAGQLLSLRADLFSREMVDELSLLQYRSFGFDPATARRMIETELGRPIEREFSEFDEHPFAAASISQIHRATLRRNGLRVVVKVQRPGIEAVLARDLKLIAWLLRRAGKIPGIAYIDWEGMIRELQRMFKEEVDYRFEVANLVRMRKLLREHKVVVPKVFRSLCSRRAIVMEYVDGVVMSDYIRMLRSDPARVEAWQDANDVRPRRVGSRLMRSFYRQVLEDNLFHGDLHPGNIVLLRKSRFALIDFGTIGNLDLRFVRLYRQQAMAFTLGDYSRAIDAYLLLADSIPPLDLDLYRAEFTEVAREWEVRTHLKELTYLERSMTGGLGNALGELNRRYRVNLSWQFLRVGRSIGTMDANLSVLLGTKNPNKILRNYMLAGRRRAMRDLWRNGLKGLGGAIVDVADTYGYLADRFRRQAIPMKAFPTRALRVAGALTRAAVTAAGLAALATLVTYLGWAERYEGTALGAVHDLYEKHPWEVVVFGAIAVVLVVRLRRELLSIAERPIERRPDGR